MRSFHTCFPQREQTQFFSNTPHRSNPKRKVHISCSGIEGCPLCVSLTISVPFSCCDLSYLFSAYQNDSLTCSIFCLIPLWECFGPAVRMVSICVRSYFSFIRRERHCGDIVLCILLICQKQWNTNHFFKPINKRNKTSFYEEYVQYSMSGKV